MSVVYSVCGTVSMAKRMVSGIIFFNKGTASLLFHSHISSIQYACKKFVRIVGTSLCHQKYCISAPKLQLYFSVKVIKGCCNNTIWWMNNTHIWMADITWPDSHCNPALTIVIWPYCSPKAYRVIMTVNKHLIWHPLSNSCKRRGNQRYYKRTIQCYLTILQFFSQEIQL